MCLHSCVRRPCLARPTGYIFCQCFFFIFSYYFLFFGRPRNKSISGTTEWIFTQISGLVELCKSLINPAFIWRSVKERCHGNQLKSQNRRLCEKKIKLFDALRFRNKLEYRNANGQLRSALNVATSYTNLVMFGAVTPEKRLLIFVLLWKNC